MGTISSSKTCLAKKTGWNEVLKKCTSQHVELFGQKPKNTNTKELIIQKKEAVLYINLNKQVTIIFKQFSTELSSSIINEISTWFSLWLSKTYPKTYWAN